jgi:hypothetical protein
MSLRRALWCSLALRRRVATGLTPGTLRPKPRAWRQRPVPRAPRQSRSRPPARAARPRRESPSRRLEAPGAGREQACRPHGGSARRTGCTAVVLAERAVRSPLGVGSLRLLPEQDPGEALASELAVHRPQVRQRTLLPGQWRGPRKPPRLKRRIIELGTAQGLTDRGRREPETAPDRA